MNPKKLTVLYMGIHTDLLPQKRLINPGDEKPIIKMVKKAYPQIEIDEIYVDTIKTILDNRAFYRLIEDCEAGKIEKIIVPSVASISNDIVSVADHIRKICKADPNVVVYFALERLSTKSEDFQMQLTMRCMAEVEYKELQKRRKDFKAI